MKQERRSRTIGGRLGSEVACAVVCPENVCVDRRDRGWLRYMRGLAGCGKKSLVREIRAH